MGSYDNELLKAVNDIEESCVESLRKLDTKQREIDDRLLEIEQKGSARMDVETSAKSSLGVKVWKAIQENGDLLSKTDKLRIEVKAAGDVTGTSSVRNIQSGGASAPAGMILGVQSAFPTRTIGPTSAIEYSRYTGLEGAAAVQAADLENNRVDVSLAGAKIRFTLFSELRDGGSTHGRIVVSRISHTMNGEHLVIGEFSLKPDGFTDITDQRDNDPYELEYAAQPIILHFLLEALKAPITGK